MSRRIAITGASGFVGRNLLEALLKRDGDVFFPICRSLKSMETIQGRQRGKKDRLRFVSGDIEKAFCNISNPITAFGGPIDVLIHSAADTDFSQDKTDAKRAEMYAKNVLGTQNVIDLARILKPKRILYFSTAYASGNNKGPVPDEGVVATNGFKNYYEETKYAARRLMLESGLPFTIVNPTIVIGNSRNGDAEREKRMIYGYFHAMHMATKFNLLRLDRAKKGRRMSYSSYFNSVREGEEFDCSVKLVGNRKTVKNVVPVDQLVEACIAVIESPRAIGKTYNVGGTEFEIGDMLDSMQRAMKVRGFEFDPSFSGETQNDDIKDLLTKELAPYKPYVTISDPIWEDKNLRALGVNLPKITPIKFDEMMRHYVEHYLIKGRG